jgi:hypothetical protein
MSGAGLICGAALWLGLWLARFAPLLARWAGGLGWGQMVRMDAELPPFNVFVARVPLFEGLADLLSSLE